MSLHALTEAMRAELRDQGCPLAVVEGPEPTKTATFGRERIVVEHDEDAADSFGPARRVGENPRTRFVRMVAGKITIYARSALPGALDFEHRDRCDHVLDLVLVALEKAAVAKLKNAVRLVSGRFKRANDLQASEQIGGAVYELTFAIERAVNEQTWAGDKRAETTIDAVITAATLNATDVDHVTVTGA